MLEKALEGPPPDANGRAGFDSSPAASWCAVLYISTWNGRDSLTDARAPDSDTASPTRQCRVCFLRRPLHQFEPKRRVCRRCTGLRNLEKLREQRRAAVRQGFCQICLKKPALDGLTICGRCRERHREQNAARSTRLREAGLCRSCTQSLPDGWKHVRCRVCADEESRRAKEVRTRRLAAGRCATCGKRPRVTLKTGELSTRCRTCLDKAAARNRNTRASRRADQSREAANEASRRRQSAGSVNGN